MAGSRTRRVEEAVREEAADILHRLKDPRIGFVSVTGVEMSADLRRAKIYVSILGNEDERRRTMQVLAGSSGFVRTELGRRVRLFRTPEVIFQLDLSLEQGMRVDEILRSAEPSDSGETSKKDQ